MFVISSQSLNRLVSIVKPFSTTTRSSAVYGIRLTSKDGRLIAEATDHYRLMTARTADIGVPDGLDVVVGTKELVGALPPRGLRAMVFVEVHDHEVVLSVEGATTAVEIIETRFPGTQAMRDRIITSNPDDGVSRLPVNTALLAGLPKTGPNDPATIVMPEGPRCPMGIITDEWFAIIMPILHAPDQVHGWN